MPRVSAKAVLVVAALLGVSGALAQSPPLKSGIDIRLLDPAVRPQDDLFAHVNGRWVAATEIPPDRVSDGTFIELADRADRDVRDIIEEIAARPNRRPGSTAQQIVDLYTSIHDEARIEALGVAPIKPLLDRIGAIRTPQELASLAGHLSAIGAGGPFPATVEVDIHNPTLPVVRLTQGGTVLPDRDYYLKTDPESVSIRTKYEVYLARLLALIERPNPAALGKAVLAFEIQLAEAQWSQVDSRMTSRTQSRFPLSRLNTQMPGFDWPAWAKPQGIHRGSDVILTQPSFFKAFAALSQTTSLETLKAWLAARYVTALAPFLSRAFDELRFDFFGSVLSGQTLPRPRWKRGVSLVNGYLGDAVGKLYAARRFPPEAKGRIKKLVGHMKEAFRQSIKQADWLSGPARAEAMDKVSRMGVKVGAPEAFREYSGLLVKPDDLVGNIERAKKNENDAQMTRLVSEGERGYWLMTPQTVNAYYSPAQNEIVFPAAVLQPPLFDVEADDAVNYGAIGAIIGHEIGHALDERGRLIDSAGASRDWWRKEDEERYERRARVLIEQYGALSLGIGQPVNGELTLRENIGDLGGLEVAYRAWRLSLDGRLSPVIDGLTGAQRLFIGWAQAWRSKTRDEYARQMLLWNPYAPAHFRANVPASNLAAFHEAFGVIREDRMYREPASRVRIWSEPR